MFDTQGFYHFMKLKSFLKRLIIIEEVVEKFNSPINGEILIYEDLFGKHSMRIGGVSQSGGIVDQIWRRAIYELQSFKASEFQRVLILGLGCGGSAKLVNKKWPEAKITGIEIDPKVVEVGKKYFGLGEIKNLTIKISDAFDSCRKLSAVSHKPKFDLILIDLYLGKDFPKQAESEEFINNIKKLLSDKGIVVFNRFYWGQYRKQARDFEEKLKKYFSKSLDKKNRFKPAYFLPKVV